MKTPTAVFIDDDKNLLSGLSRMLRPLKDQCEMTFFDNPVTALEEIKKTCFDIVVSDMRMPEIDGVTLLNEAKKVCPYSLRIILSGQADLEKVFRSINFAHQYISKPCDSTRLKNIILSACGLIKNIPEHELKAFLANIDCLPVEPEKLDGLYKELTQEQPKINYISRIIASDLGMSSKILELVNSAFFINNTSTFNVIEGVNLLGLDLLKELVLKRNLFTSNISEKVDYEMLRIIEQNSIHSSYSQQVGKLLLLSLYHQKYSNLIHKGLNQQELLNKEKEEFGYNHAELGAYLLKLWGVPVDVEIENHTS